MTANDAQGFQKVGLGQLDIQVYLIVPPGLFWTIFPWGVHCLAESVGANFSKHHVEIWDAAHDIQLRSLWKPYCSSANQILSLLRPRAATAFFGLSNDLDFFLGVLASLGNSFFTIAEEHKLFRNKMSVDRYRRQYGGIIQQLYEETDAFFRKEIEKRIHRANDRHRLYGISVYDGTLFMSLTLAAMIRRLDPKSTILAGGDHFTSFDSARRIIYRADQLDAIIVGFGEDVLTQVIRTLQKKMPLSELEAPGLISRRTVDEDLPGRTTAKCLAMPKCYSDLDPKSVSYARSETDHLIPMIRILPQRGCRWGRCSFCDIITRRFFREFPVAQVMEDFQSRVASLAAAQEQSSKRLIIIFDSDDNNWDLVMNLAEYLERNTDYACYLTCWLQVKSFRPEFIFKLKNIDPQRILCHFGVNLESLNSTTLKIMRKGHSVIQCIEVLKGLVDCGQRVSSALFTQFPLETIHSVRQEIALLRQVAHLLVNPLVRISLNSFFPNPDCEITRHEKKYGIRVRRRREDIWLSAVFCLDLPFNNWGLVFKHRLKFDLDAIARKINKKLFELFESKNAIPSGSRAESPRRWAKIKHALVQIGFLAKVWLAFLGLALLGRTVFIRRIRFQLFLKKLRTDLSWQTSETIRTVQRIIDQEVSRVDIYLSQHFLDPSKRTMPIDFLTSDLSIFGMFLAEDLLLKTKARRITDKIELVKYARTLEELFWGLGLWSDKEPPQSSPFQPLLYIEGCMLHKRFNIPGCHDSWSIELEDTEIRLLRFLYWRHRIDDIDREFMSIEVPRSRWKIILDKHVRLGSVLFDDGWYLCIANDPAYWKTQFSSSKDGFILNTSIVFGQK